MKVTLADVLASKVGKLNQHLVGPDKGKIFLPDTEILARGPEGLRQIGSEGLCNKTEAAYLAWLRTLGDHKIWVQSIGLRLSKKCFYYPDFGVLDEKGGLRFIDTKAVYHGQTKPHLEDDALVKMKWAAQLYFPWRFLIAWRVGGTWTHKQIG